MLYVVVGIRRGLIEEVRATESEEKASEIEKELCESLEIPIDSEDREAYYRQCIECNEVHRYEVELENI